MNFNGSLKKWVTTLMGNFGNPSWQSPPLEKKVKLERLTW
jgi:hypothetical protein